MWDNYIYISHTRLTRKWKIIKKVLSVIPSKMMINIFGYLLQSMLTCRSSTMKNTCNMYSSSFVSHVVGDAEFDTMFWYCPVVKNKSLIPPLVWQNYFSGDSFGSTASNLKDVARLLIFCSKLNWIESNCKELDLFQCLPTRSVNTY